MARDMSQAQFDAALKRHNIRRDWFGYYVVTWKPNGTPRLHVYAGNAGPRRRSQLAYLLREQHRDELREVA